MTAGLSAREEWRRNWKIVLASFLGASLYGMPFYSFGIFIGPLQAEFGWSSAAIGGAVTFVSVVTFALSPVVGRLIDRTRLINLAVPGVLAYCGAFALLSTLTSSVLHWWIMWAVIGIFAPVVTANIWSAAVAKSFETRRGFALALTLSGAGLGAFVAPLAANLFVNTWGWRAAYVALAACYLVVLLPAVLFGLSGDRAPGPPKPTVAPASGPKPARAGALSPAFVQLVTACGLSIACGSALMVYLVPILVSHELTRGEAALAAGSIGIASVTARLVTGLLLDRFNTVVIGTLAFLLPGAAAVALVLQDGSLAMALAAGLLLGASVGAELDVQAYVISRYFGTANYGGLFGIVVSVLALGQGAGPVLAGLIFDWSANYNLVLWSILPVCLASALLIALIGRPPSQAAAEPT